MDVHKWNKTCIHCQKCKVQRHTVTPLSTFNSPDARFNTIHIDIIGPLPPPKGYSYLLTCVDHFTHWPEAIPTTNITVETVASAYVSGWILRFGIPSTVSTDRGSQFESTLWSLKEDIQCSSAEQVYGTTLCLPGEFFYSIQDDTITEPAAYITRLKSDMLHYKPPQFASNLQGKYTCIPICQLALMSLYVMMLIENNCYKPRTMALIRYLSELKSISQWMLRAIKRLFHWINLNQHISNISSEQCQLGYYHMHKRVPTTNLYQMLERDSLILDDVSIGQSVSISRSLAHWRGSDAVAHDPYVNVT